LTTKTEEKYDDSKESKSVFLLGNMSLRNDSTTELCQTLASSRSRYKGDRSTRKVSGMLTPMALHTTPHSAYLDEPRMMNHDLGVRKSRFIWQTASHDPPRSRYRTDNFERSQRQPMYDPEQCERFAFEQAKTQPRAELAYNAAGLVHATNHRGHEGTSPGYVAAIRLREQMRDPVTRHTVSVPRIVITPAAPTISAIPFEENSVMNNEFLNPPASCYRRKDRERQAQFHSEWLTMLRKRNSGYQLETGQSNERKADTVLANDRESRRERVRSAALKYEHDLYSKLRRLGF